METSTSFEAAVGCIVVGVTEMVALRDKPSLLSRERVRFKKSGAPFTEQAGKLTERHI